MKSKYAPFSQGNIVLLIPEISEALDPHIIPGITGLYFCQRRFATWDMMPVTKELVAKLAESCITTKFFQLQPEYMGTRCIRVTVRNVPANLPGVVVAPFLSANGRGEEMAKLRATAGTADGDHALLLCLDRGGFQAIPNTLYLRDRHMLVVVEGRQQHCCNCKRIGDLAKVCSQKAADIIQ